MLVKRGREEKVRCLALRGLDGTGDLLGPFREAAPPGVECAVIRYPVDAALGYEALVSYVAGRLPPDRVVLIAESFSGPVAVRLTERLRGRVAALVLCNSFVTPPRSPLLRLAARTATFRLRVPERILAALMLAPLATPELIALFSETLQRVDPSVMAARVRELLAVDDRAALRRIDVPVLYLRGTRDRLVPEKAVRRVVEALPAVTVCRIDAPHALLQTAPAAAWRAIESLSCDG